MQEIKITCEVTDRVEYKSIKPFQGKLKELSKENFEKIKKSILEEGFFMPIGVWENDGVLSCLDGHQRLLVLEWLENNGHKIPLIPVFRIIADSFKNARKKLLHLVSQYGKVTGQGLYEFSIESEIGLDDLKDFSIPDLNIDSFMQEFFEDNTVEPGCDEDETPEPPIEPKTKLGDIYILGNHKLMCGDSTSIDAVEKLMDGQKADMVFTDPPYGVDYEGINNDSRSGLSNLLSQVFNNYFLTMKEGGSIYVFHSDRCADIFHDEFRKLFHFSSIAIWVKPNLVMSQTDYHSRHEPIIYGWKKGKPHNWFSDRKQDSVWEFGREKADGHTTPKPVKLIEYALINSSKKGQAVIDLFGGSGSTLIACEKTKRNCFMMELDPKYCDVIVSRFLKFTKGTKVIRNGEEINWF